MPWRRAIIAVLAAALLLVGPMLPMAVLRLIRSQTFPLGIAWDVCAGFAVLWGLLWVGRAWTTDLSWRGSWRSWSLSLAWTGLVVFQAARALTRATANQDLPLYDVLLLSKHLYILGRDLYGGAATLVLVVAVCTPPLLLVVGGLSFGRLEDAARRLGARWAAGAWLGVLAVCGGFEVGLWSTQWVMPALVNNAAESVSIFAEVRREIEQRPHRALEDVELPRTPDVHIYIVESYGRVLDAPPMVDRWAAALQVLDLQLTEAGWHTASGWSAAPVQGGRSWIADTSLLMGLHVGHQATYQHVIGMVDRLPHLPGFFADQGYTTVLVRPKDLARPGVQLQNHFRFDRTVFALDLAYEGPVVGWGVVPDQYTMDFVDERVLSTIETPTFAFFHLVTAHVPWSSAPELHGHYSEWQGREGRTVPVHEERDLKSEFRMQMARWKRIRKPGKTAEDGQRERYVDNVLYDLFALGRLLQDGPSGDGVVVIMGDHQPPLVTKGTNPDVPVHVLASDPTLLEGWLETGFEPGLRPPPTQATLAHRDLFAVLVRSLLGDAAAP